MDALLPAFLAALIGEWGDKTQMVAALLAARFGRTGPILAGIAAAAFANSLISAAGGTIVAELAPFRAITLMLALALLFAGAGAFWPRKGKPDIMLAGTGASLASVASFFVAEFGDKTQFLTFAIAAHSGTPWLAACGATAGIMGGIAPVVLLGPALGRAMPVRLLQIGAAILFLIAGGVTALIALRLV